MQRDVYRKQALGVRYLYCRSKTVAQLAHARNIKHSKCCRLGVSRLRWSPLGPAGSVNSAIENNVFNLSAQLS